MDRSYRRILHATTILALPLALLVASFSVADEPAQTQMLQPGGVLQAFTRSGSNPSAVVTPNHQPSGIVQPAGLLDAVFGTNKPKQTLRQKNAASNAAKNREVNANRTPPNWNGIPFHAPTNTNMQRRSAHTPIRDPARVVRQQPAVTNAAIPKPRSLAESRSVLKRSATIQATPASSRIQPAPEPLRERPLVAAKETSRREKRDPVISKPLPSKTVSSRRTDRRTLSSLNRADLITKPTKLSAPKVEIEADLVPKVSRRPITIEKPVEKKPVAKKEVAKPAPKKLTVVEKPLPKPAPKVVEPKVQPKPAAAKLAEPKVAELKAAPAPTKSVAPPAPMPSQNIAHRVGPTPSDFEPVSPVKEMELAPRNVDAMKPIGSGVLDPGNNETNAPAFVATPPAAKPVRTQLATEPLVAEPALTREAAKQPIQARPPEARLAQTPQFGVPMQGQRIYSTDPYAPSYSQPYQTQQAVPTQPIPTYQPQQPAPVPDANAPITNEMRNVKPVAPKQPIKAGITSELPGIRVVTQGPNEVMIRQTHQFEIRVENRGSIDAQGVMVRAMIPDWAEVRGQSASRGSISPKKIDGAERLVWNIEELPAGASERMIVRLKAERSGTHGLDVDWTLVPQKSVTQIKVQEPRLQLTIEGPEQIVYGKSQSYRVRVLNPGDGIAPNVVFTLSPNSSTPQTQRIGNIPPGKEAQFEVELTAQDLGNLKIDGLATGDLELRAVASKTIRVSAAKLEAILTGPELKYQNTDATYSLQLQNTGVATSENVIATLQLPPGAKYLGGLDKAKQQGSRLQWEIKTLPPGATRDYQFRCKLAVTGQQNFAFNCKGTAAGDANVSLATRVESIADLVMTINDPAAPAPVGSDVTYEIVIRNRGSKAADDVRAIAQFSHGIEPRRVDGHSGEILTGQVLFDPITRIAPGDEVKLRVVAKADREGHHRFRSEIRSGDTVLVSEEATHYLSQRTDRVSRRSSETPKAQR